MAASLNKVQFIGNIGRDVDFRDHGNGFMTAQFSLATSESWRERGENGERGERRERTDWHRIEARGPLAEIVRDIMGQGDQVYVEGKLQHDKVERKDEPGKFDYFTKIVAESVQKLGKRERAESPSDAGGDAGSYGDGEHSGAGGDAPSAAAPSPSAAPAARSSAGGASKWRNRGAK